MPKNEEQVWSSRMAIAWSIGSLGLGRSLLRAGLVDRFRVIMFPVITGATGAERICDGYPDVALEMIDHRTSTPASNWSSTGPACSSTHRSTPPHDSKGQQKLSAFGGTRTPTF